MNDFPQQRDAVGPIENADEPSGELTRRTVLAGVAATTMAATVAGFATPASARDIDPNSPRDMVLFVLLSAALTGIAEPKLAPGFRAKDKNLKPADLAIFLAQLKPSDLPNLNPGSDPVNIKRDYFSFVRAQPGQPLPFEALLNIAEGSVGAPDREKAILDKVKVANDDVRYLARSIALMWYLGAWYEPSDLRLANTTPNSTPNFKVISSKAYTQGWALRVAQAHPMGFSQMQFGYWNVEPNLRSDFTGS